MPLPKNPAVYAHVKQILDAALSHTKCVYTLPSPAAATRWRQEAYYFRRLSGSPAYDNFILRLDGPKVIIEKRAVPGTLTTEDGKRIEPAQPEGIDADLSAMEKAAFDLARNLGLEIEDDTD
jgi:hypothetical protein